MKKEYDIYASGSTNTKAMDSSALADGIAKGEKADSGEFNWDFKRRDTQIKQATNEIVQVVESAGLTPDENDDTQMNQAIDKKIAEADSITTVNLVPDGNPVTKKVGKAPTKAKNFDFKFETYDYTFRGQHIYLSTKPSIYGATLQVLENKIPDLLNGKLNACDVLPKGGGQPQTLAQNCEVLKLKYLIRDSLSKTDFTVNPSDDKIYEFNLASLILDFQAYTGITTTPSKVYFDYINIQGQDAGTSGVGVITKQNYTIQEGYNEETIFTKSIGDALSLKYDSATKKLIITSSVPFTLLTADFKNINFQVGE